MSWTSIALRSFHIQRNVTLRSVIIRKESQCCSFSTAPSLYKSKSSFASQPAPPTVGDVPVINTKGKGPKGASKNQTGPNTKRGNVEQERKEDEGRYKSSTQDQNLPGESFEEDGLKANMQRAVHRCKETINQKISSYGRADPCESISEM